MFFGIHISLPAAENDKDGNENGGSRVTVLVRLLDDSPAASLHRNICLGVDDFQAKAATDHNFHATSRLLPPANAISSLPLCDRARFERSGVLLA